MKMSPNGDLLLPHCTRQFLSRVWFQRSVFPGPVLEDWDIISPKDVIGSDQLQGEKRSLASTALPFTQSLLSQVTDDVLHPVSQLFYQPVSAAFSQVPHLLMQS